MGIKFIHHSLTDHFAGRRLKRTVQDNSDWEALLDPLAQNKDTYSRWREAFGQVSDLASDEQIDALIAWGENWQQQDNLFGLDWLPRLYLLQQRYDELTKILTDLEFLDDKCEAGMAYRLQDDYTTALSARPKDTPSLLSAIAKAYSQEVYYIHEFDPQVHTEMSRLEFILQQLRNRVIRNTKGRIDLCNHFDLDLSHIILHHRPLRPNYFSKSIPTRATSDQLHFAGALRYTPTGDRLIVASVARKAPCIDPLTGEIQFFFRCLGRAIAFDFSADGATVVFGGDMGSGTSNGFVQVFDIASRAALGSIKMKVVVLKIVVTAGDKALVLCADGKVRVMSLPDLKHIKTWAPYGDRLCFALAVDEDRDLVATGEVHDEDRPSSIKVWNAATLEVLKELRGPKYGVTALAFSNDRLILFSGSRHLNNGFVAWTWVQGDSEANDIILSHKQYIRERLSKEGSIICSLETSDTVADIAVFPNSHSAVTVEGSHLQKSDAITIFDVFCQEQREIGKVTGHSSVCVGVDIDCQGRWIATLHAKGEVFLWPATTMRTLHNFKVNPMLKHHSTDASCTHILSQDTSGYGKLYVTETDTGVTQAIREGHVTCSHGAVISPSRRFFARTYWERLPVNPYSVEYPNNEEVAQRWFKQFKATTRCCCYLEALGSTEASGSKWPAWAMGTGLNTMQIAVSPDTRQGFVLLTDDKKNQFLFRFYPDSGEAGLVRLHSQVRNIQFSPDGKYLVMVSFENNTFFLLELERREVSFRTYLCPEVDEVTRCAPQFVGADSFVIARNSGEVLLLRPYDEARQLLRLNDDTVPLRIRERYKHPYSIVDLCVSADGKRLALSDTYPATMVLQIPSFRSLYWRPMDQLCTNIFFDQQGRCLLAIGQYPEIEGLHYSLMNMPK